MANSEGCLLPTSMARTMLLWLSLAAACRAHQRNRSDLREAWMQHFDGDQPTRLICGLRWSIEPWPSFRAIVAGIFGAKRDDFFGNAASLAGVRLPALKTLEETRPAAARNRQASASRRSGLADEGLREAIIVRLSFAGGRLRFAGSSRCSAGIGSTQRERPR